MPIYQYRCRTCGELRDEWHKHEEVVFMHCQCGDRMDRIISAPNVIMPVYRAEELVNKKDGGNAEQDYKRKLNSSLR
jgi:putative FmdB family regulatory protein